MYPQIVVAGKLCNVVFFPNLPHYGIMCIRHFFAYTFQSENRSLSQCDGDDQDELNLDRTAGGGHLNLNPSPNAAVTHHLHSRYCQFIFARMWYPSKASRRPQDDDRWYFSTPNVGPAQNHKSSIKQPCNFSSKIKIEKSGFVYSPHLIALRGSSSECLNRLQRRMTTTAHLMASSLRRSRSTCTSDDTLFHVVVVVVSH